MSLAQVRNRIEVGGLERASSEEKGQSGGEGRGDENGHWDMLGSMLLV